MGEDLVDRLAELCGIQRSYFDAFGEERWLSPETRAAFLAAMGVDVANAAAVHAAIREREDGPWRRLLPPVVVVRADDAVAHVTVTTRASDAELTWRCVEEGGATHAGRVATNTLSIAARSDVDGVARARLRLPLPPLPLGYHRLAVVCDAREAETQVIVAPRTCYVPPALAEGRRLWGPTAQIYALRSNPDLGVGTYASLAQLTSVAAQHGAGFVGVSPLHALFPAAPSSASPYSPSSRLFLNVAYLELAAVPELAGCAAAQRMLAQTDTRSLIESAVSQELVDYAAVAAIKRPVLELLFAHFREEHLPRDDARAGAFHAFAREGGEALALHALHDALQEHLLAQDPQSWGWPMWPVAYRDPRGAAARAFAEAHRDRVDFFIYLQWLADEQLAAAASSARHAGMPVGLYLDLAVGVDRAGSEAWIHQELFARAVGVGAPPDELAPKGQDWGLPPMLPERLVEAAYAPFAATLRRCMRHAGALRLDHVMGLLRLFWVPPGQDATHGGYVRYPFEDLLGVLALESQRSRCLVIGEDLGTVPDEVRAQLAEHRVLSYRVFYFERGEGGRPKVPAEYPGCALVTAGTHDLATLTGFWSGRDVALRGQLDLYPSREVYEGQVRGRAEHLRLILEVLSRAQLLDVAGASPREAMTAELTRAIYAYLAATPSWLLGVQLEDVLGVEEQANLPGTVQEHPNWRRRLPLSVTQIGELDAWARLVEALRRAGR